MFWKIHSQNLIKIGNRQSDTACVAGLKKQTETRIKILGRTKGYSSKLLAVMC